MASPLGRWGFIWAVGSAPNSTVAKVQNYIYRTKSGADSERVGSRFGLSPPKSLYILRNSKRRRPSPLHFREMSVFIEDLAKSGCPLGITQAHPMI